MSLVWTKTSAPSENMFWTCVASSSTGQNLAATASGGGIWTSGDYGASWAPSGAPVAPNGGGWTRIVSDHSGQYLAAAIYGGLIWHSGDYGLNWNQQTSGPGNAYWDGLASDSTGRYLVAVEHCVGIFNSDDYGVTWYKNQPPGSDWYLIWSCVTSDSTGQNLAAATITSSIGGVSQLWTSTNGQAGSGVTWTKEPSSTIPPVTFWCMASDSTGRYLAAGPGTSTVGPGAIYTSDTSGQTWFATASGNQRWTSIASDSTGANLAAATSSSIYITTNGTASPASVTWTLSNNLNINWTSVASDQTGANLVAVTTGNGIYSTYTQLQPGAYVAYGTDLTSIFAAQSSLPLAQPTYYGQAGADLNTIYEAYIATDASATGFLVNGLDLNQIFEGV